MVTTPLRSFTPADGGRFAARARRVRSRSEPPVCRYGNLTGDTGQRPNAKPPGEVLRHAVEVGISSSFTGAVMIPALFFTRRFTMEVR